MNETLNIRAALALGMEFTDDKMLVAFPHGDGREIFGRPLYMIDELQFDSSFDWAFYGWNYLERKKHYQLSISSDCGWNLIITVRKKSVIVSQLSPTGFLKPEHITESWTSVIEGLK